MSSDDSGPGPDKESDPDDVEQVVNRVDVPDPEDAPEVADHPGLWDEYISGVIVVLPFLAGIAGLAYALYADILTVGTIEVAGTVNVAYLVYAVAGLILLTYLLAVMKFFGSSPVAWLASIADSYARD
jgi:hypothetical protein